MTCLLAAAGLAVAAPALAVDNVATNYAGAATGNWSAGGGPVEGPPDGSCANMGANGKANFLSGFGFNIPLNATITGITAYTRRGTANDETVIFQLADDVTVPSFIGTTQNILVVGQGGGSCDSTIAGQYPPTDNNNLLSGWGVASITANTVNSPNFGVGLTTNSNGTVKFDSVCFAIAYTTASGPAVQDQCLTSPSQPLLTLVKSSPTVNYDAVDEIITYSYLITNAGTGAADFPITVSDNKAIVSCPPNDGGGPNNGDALLDPGESITCSSSYTVDQADIDAGSVTNQATATSDDGTQSNQDSVTIPAVQIATMTVVKTSPTAQVTSTGPVSYSYLVTNTGNIALTGIALSDDNDNNDMSCPATTLPPTGFMTCTATHTVTQAEINANGSPVAASGNLSNTVTASSNESPNAQNSLDIPIQQTRSLDVTKTGTWNDNGSTANIAEVGETVSYTITVLNDGNTDETSVSVTDPLITGAPNNGSISCPGGNPIPSLLVNAEVDCTATYTLVQADLNNGSVSNTATATAASGATDNGTDDVNLPNALGLSLVKTGVFNDDTTNDGFAQAGETITYTFAVTNDSSVAVTNVSVSDPKVPTITCPGGNPIPSIAANATVNCSGDYTLTQGDVNTGQVVNTATASSADVPDDATDDETVVLNQNIAFTVQKDGVFQDDGAGGENGDNLAQPGETINYTIAVENTGFVTLTNVLVTDPLLSTVTCPGGNPIPGIAPGATVNCTGSYAVTQSDINAGQVLNTATADPDEAPSQNNGADVDLPTLAAATVLKASITTQVSAPGPVLYTYRIDNTGNVTLTNIQASDDNDDNDLSCPVTTLEPAEHMLCGATRTVVQDDFDNNGSPVADSGVLFNVVTVTADELPAEPPVTADFSIDIITDAQMAIEKNSPFVVVSEAGPVDYSYTITNPGNVTLTGITVSDDHVDGAVDCGGTTELAPNGQLLCSAVYTVTQGDLDDFGSPVAQSGELYNEVTADSDQTEAVTADLAIPMSDDGVSIIRVVKSFSDGNPAEIVVELNCNAGDDLIQNFPLGDGDVVSFNIQGYESGEVNCRVQELGGPNGYTPNYSAVEVLGTAGDIRSEVDGCYFDEIESGVFECAINNTLDGVEIEVTKEWIGDIDQLEAHASLEASADYTCFNVLEGPAGPGGQVNGTLFFEGEEDTEIIVVYPSWGADAQNPSYCTVVENQLYSFVEADDSDCAMVVVESGDEDVECTITNTPFFEGIPTMSRTGLILLVLTMLGVGMVGLRRFV